MSAAAPQLPDHERSTRATKVWKRVVSGGRILTSPLRPLPDFLVIGAMRSGSTSLYRNLSMHPQVGPAKHKEVHYFDLRYRRGTLWYRSNFPTRRALRRREAATGSAAITGEASPYYLFHPLVPQRVHDALPDAKLIAILRDPVDRAVSNYHMQVRRNLEDRPMAEAMAVDIERQGHHPPPDAPEWNTRGAPVRRTAYVGRGRYAEQLERWYERFPREQLLVVETASLSRGDGQGFARVVEFLGLDPWRPHAFSEHNVASYPPAETEVREHLREYFAPYNRRLFDLLGVEFDWSGAQPG